GGRRRARLRLAALSLAGRRLRGGRRHLRGPLRRLLQRPLSARRQRPRRGQVLARGRAARHAAAAGARLAEVVLARRRGVVVAVVVGPAGDQAVAARAQALEQGSRDEDCDDDSNEHGPVLWSLVRHTLTT